jgi:hypothetical protein
MRFNAICKILSGGTGGDPSPEAGFGQQQVGLRSCYQEYR